MKRRSTEDTVEKTVEKIVSAKPKEQRERIPVSRLCIFLLFFFFLVMLNKCLISVLILKTWIFVISKLCNPYLVQ